MVYTRKSKAVGLSAASMPNAINRVDGHEVTTPDTIVVPRAQHPPEKHASQKRALSNMPSKRTSFSRGRDQRRASGTQV